MKLTIVTPKKSVFQNKDIEEVIFVGHEGELNILPQHAPLVTTLQEGVLRYFEKGKQQPERLQISWGYCEVIGDQVKVLAEKAETL